MPHTRATNGIPRLIINKKIFKCVIYLVTISRERVRIITTTTYVQRSFRVVVNERLGPHRIRIGPSRIGAKLVDV